MTLSRRDLGDAIQQAMARFGVAGISAAFLEQHRDASIESFGTCRGGGRIDAGTVFAVASLSKPPFAYMVVRLSNRGVLDLDAPLARLYPEPYDAYGLDPEAPELRQITARQVLSHASGMRNWEEEDAGRIQFRPGSRWHYSGEGYVYLQAVVEHLTGTALERLAEAEVFRPLGMRATAYLWRPPGESPRRTGRGTCTAEGHEFTRAYASHSLHTTASDYARFVVHALHAEIGQEMLTPQVKIDHSLAWGLGWGVAGHVFWHWGEMGHFQCAAVASRLEERGLVCLTNGDEGLAACAEIIGSTLGDDFARPIRAVLDRGW